MRPDHDLPVTVRGSYPPSRQLLLIVVIGSMFCPCVPLLFVSVGLAFMWAMAAVGICFVAVVSLLGLSCAEMRRVAVSHGWDRRG